MSTQLLKKALTALVLGGLVFVVLQRFNLMPGARKQEAAVPDAVQLGDATTTSVPTLTPAGHVTAVALPSAKVAKATGPVIRWNVWFWNAQMALMFANGGPLTTEGSLLAQHGVTVKLTRQDDTEQSKTGQLKFAQALAAGSAQPADGVHFVTIMGDGAAVYLASINTQLAKLGPDYRAEIIGAVGYSRGEDAFWGPAEWKDNCDALKGGVTAGVLRDGDWNIAQFMLANCGIKNNPDETTYDPEAMNWVASGDYLKAVEQYVAGYCEDRPVVRAGKLTSEPKHRTCVQGVVTWTPGDVNLAKQKGGLVRLLSTAENAYQMPAVIIGIHAWDVQNAKRVQGLLAAVTDAADQVRQFAPALTRAAQASYAVYAEQSPAWILKYYRGVVERDKAGSPVPLGGSTVMNLADNLVLFGLAEGAGGLGNSVFKAAYEGFGHVAQKQYPRLIPAFPLVADAVNPSFLSALAAAAQPDAAGPVLATFEAGSGPIEAAAVVAKRNWNIAFDTGRATLTPASTATLTELYNQLLVGGGLQVELDGHTDNVGNPDANQTLSEARAVAVKAWLEAKNPILFPAGRVVVRAFGASAPLTSNGTPEGRAANRRVTVVLGTKV